MTIATLALLGLAFSLDLLIGEPPNAFHPVAWFGRLVDAVDRPWRPDDRGERLIGVAIALVLPLLPAVVAAGSVLLAARTTPLAGTIVAGVVLFLTISLRSLLELTESVVELTDRDVETARERIRGLVGRNASRLSPAELRSAAIESAAENLSDGLVASLLPFALLAPLSLPIAAGAAAWVKGVNTLDSMLGYPEKPIGTASARLDDLVMWGPARITAASIAAATATPSAIRSAREWARVPASPNSGWPMATLACVLSVRLTKPGAYDLNPDADLPTVADCERAVTVVGLAAVVSVLVAAVLATGTTALAAGLELGGAETIFGLVSTIAAMAAEPGVRS